MEMREFTDRDWSGFAGAEAGPDGEPPLIGFTPAHWPDAGEVVVIADATGVSIHGEDCTLSYDTESLEMSALLAAGLPFAELDWNRLLVAGFSAAWAPGSRSLPSGFAATAEQAREWLTAGQRTAATLEELTDAMGAVSAADAVNAAVKYAVMTEGRLHLHHLTPETLEHLAAGLREALSGGLVAMPEKMRPIFVAFLDTSGMSTTVRRLASFLRP